MHNDKTDVLHACVKAATLFKDKSYPDQGERKHQEEIQQVLELVYYQASTVSSQL